MDTYETPELVHLGTVADLTQGAGDETPEQSGSTFPMISDRRVKKDIRPL